MANQAWLDEVRERLAKHALPPKYIQRFMDELSDHFQDITEESMNTDVNVSSRLGESNHVADSAVKAYQRHSFLGRHPTAAFLVFGFTPIVSIILLWGVTIAGMLAFWETCEWIGVDLRPVMRSFKRFEPVTSTIAPYFESLFLIIVPSIIASVFYCKLVKRLGIGKKWILVSCIVLGTMALLPICSMNISYIPGKSVLSVGAGVPLCLDLEHLTGVIVSTIRNPQQLFQFLAPLAVGLWFLWRKRNLTQMRLAS